MWLTSYVVIKKYTKYTPNSVISHLWQPKCTWYYGVYLVLSWMRDTIELVWHVTSRNNTKEMWGQFEFVLPSLTLVWSTPLGLPEAMWQMHAPTFNKWHKKKKKKKTLHMLTHGAMRGCGLTSLVVCINDKFCDIRERNVTIRSEIWTTKIRSLGLQDIRECDTLWEFILRSFRCTHLFTARCMRHWCWENIGKLKVLRYINSTMR